MVKQKIGDILQVGIIGKANSGKNTVGKLLCSACADGQKAVHLAFADPIKEMAQTLFPALPNKYLYGSSKYRSEVIPGAFKDGKPLTVRQLLIDLGTSAREYNPNIWIDILHYRLNEAKKKNPSIIVINDVRFKNEFEFLNKLGFYQLKLHRDEYTVIDHISETDQDNIQDSQVDCILYNNGTLNNLKENVQKIAEMLFVSE